MLNNTLDRYLEPRQASRKEPTEYENLFGDTLERAFVEGVRNIQSLTEQFNLQGPSAPSGKPWTIDSLADELARLAEA